MTRRKEEATPVDGHSVAVAAVDVVVAIGAAETEWLCYEPFLGASPASTTDSAVQSGFCFPQ